MIIIIVVLVLVVLGMLVASVISSAATYATARAAKQIADVAEIQATTALVDKAANFMVLLLVFALVIGVVVITVIAFRKRQEGRSATKQTKGYSGMGRGENAPVALPAGSSIDKLTELITLKMLMDLQEDMGRKRQPAKREQAYLDEYIDIDN